MRFPRKLAGLVLAAGMLAGVAAGTAPAKAASLSNNVQFVSTTTPTDPILCLTALPGSTYAYEVSMQVCNLLEPSPTQEWTPVSLGGGIYKFVNVAVGWCLDAYSPQKPTNGRPIILWDCSANISDTHWAWNPSTSIQPLSSRVWGTTGFCLDDPGGLHIAGPRMQLWTCNNTPAQKWQYVWALIP
jgi:hypothetical protein